MENLQVSFSASNA